MATGEVTIVNKDGEELETLEIREGAELLAQIGLTVSLNRTKYIVLEHGVITRKISQNAYMIEVSITATKVEEDD